MFEVWKYAALNRICNCNACVKIFDDHIIWLESLSTVEFDYIRRLWAGFVVVPVRILWKFVDTQERDEFLDYTFQ